MGPYPEFREQEGRGDGAVSVVGVEERADFAGAAIAEMRVTMVAPDGVGHMFCMALSDHDPFCLHGARSTPVGPRINGDWQGRVASISLLTGLDCHC
jgi:hypothetical protein